MPAPARRDVGPRRVLALLLPASIAMYATYQGLVQILIPAQVEHIDPAGKIASLAIITAIAAFAAALGVVAGGALSDGTPGRAGRRAPWLAASALASAILLVVLSTRTSIFAVGVSYLALWFTMNFYQGALTAVLPDRIPEHMRGVASSVFGLGLPVGILVGVNFVARAPQYLGYACLALFLLLSTVAFIVFAPEERRRDHTPVARSAAPRSRSGFFSSFASADFTYAFIGRMLMFLAFFTVTGYQLYMLEDYIGLASLPQGSPKIALSVLSTIQTSVWIVAISVAGWLADRLDRRKLFVGVCSIGMAVAMLIPVLSPTWTGIVIFQVCLGIFFGIFMSVDVALISLVLPDPEAAGRDLGLLSIAGLPGVAATMIAAALIKLWGYEAIFLFSGAASLLGGLVVFLIRSVR